jgi:O-acetyl-ADP-ribose deacetylase (regulator of RNase III)
VTDATQWISPTGKSLRLERGDITRVAADAIVNAANSRLAGGGGVDGAIHDAAGPSVMAELDEIRAKIGHCPTGKAVLTKAGRLKAQYIIHAVGPVYRGGGEGEAELLASCYRESLRMAAERGLRSVAFPAISTGIYGYPPDLAAQIALRETTALLAQPSGIEDVLFVLFGKAAFESFQAALRLLCA